MDERASISFFLNLTFSSLDEEGEGIFKVCGGFSGVFIGWIGLLFIMGFERWPNFFHLWKRSSAYFISYFFHQNTLCLRQMVFG